MSTSSMETMAGANGALDSALLREEVGEALERLSRILLQRASDPLRADPDGGPESGESEIQELIGFLGRVAAGWSAVPETAFPLDGAGYGSNVIVEDRDTGQVETFTLMAGPMIDFDAGHVSLASPIGQALLGVTVGAAVDVETPRGLRRLRVLSVRTLRDMLESEAVRA